MFITNYVYYSAVSPFPCQNWATLIFANFGTVLGFELRALYLLSMPSYYLSHSTSPVYPFLEMQQDIVGCHLEGLKIILLTSFMFYFLQLVFHFINTLLLY
jgi:hypothetical protein